MSGLELVTKACTKCGEIKTGGEFHKGSAKFGLQSRCKDCVNAHFRERRQRQIAELGEDAVRHKEAVRIARYRDRTGNKKGRLYNKAVFRALSDLRENHQREYEVLLDQHLREVGYR